MSSALTTALDASSILYGKCTSSNPPAPTRQQNHYYINSPRGTDNEYMVCVASTPEAVAWCESQNYDRITRTAAIRQGITRIRENKRDAQAGYQVDDVWGGLYGVAYLEGRSYSDLLAASASALDKYVKSVAKYVRSEDNE